MDLRRIIRENWKGAVVGLAVGAAAMYAGPVGGKIAGKVVPKALEHVKDAPITALKAHESPFSKESVVKKPVEITLRLSTREREMLNDVAKDWGIVGRLSCMTVQPE
jgi:hypothetical protein